MTDVPIGPLTIALLLDAVGGRGREPVARRLIGAGVLASLPTARRARPRLLAAAGP